MLAAFAGGSLLWMLASVAELDGARTILAWLGIPMAALMAGYTAFLFGQAEGRDLWQSPVLFWHLLAQAAMVGGGAMAVLGVGTLEGAALDLVAAFFVLGTVAHLLILLVEYAGKHASRQASVAARVITHGRYARLFWLGSVAPTLVALVLGAVTWAGGPLALLVVAGVLVAAGPARLRVRVRPRGPGPAALLRSHE